MEDKRFLIVGNPNTGKTTLFNNLTRSREKIANYSGVTVKDKSKIIKFKGEDLEFVDLPGVYSLSSTSEDEVVTKDYLNEYKNDSIIYVCSSAEIKKNLILLSDLIKQKHKIVVVVNKTDNGIDGKTLKKFEKALGVPIIQTDVRKERDGLLEWLSTVIAKRIDDKLDFEKLLSFFPTDAPTLALIDKFLLHPILGKLFVLVVFGAILVISYGRIGLSLSAIMERYIDLFGDRILKLLTNAGIGSINGFVKDVIIESVGMVVVYLPQLALMLTLLFLLEEIGYLPRVATLFNFPLQKLGMNGKSVFSLIMGFGCTTSAVLTTRNIGNRKERLETVKFLPFIGCSAKLPILMMVGQMVLGGQGLLVVCLVYLSSAVIGLCYIAFTRSKEESVSILEIPKLKRPSVVRALKESFFIVFDLFKKICLTVLASTSILWVLLKFTPNLELATGGNSILEKIATCISVIFRPLGLDNPKIVIALVSGLLAKENVLSTIGLMGGLGEVGVVASVTFLIFVMLYSPCVPALRCVGCEVGKRQAIWMFMVNTLIAYLSAFVFSTFARVSLILGFVALIVIGVLLILFNLSKKNKQKSGILANCRIKN